jgi:hypothetical protein
MKYIKSDTFIGACCSHIERIQWLWKYQPPSGLLSVPHMEVEEEAPITLHRPTSTHDFCFLNSTSVSLTLDYFSFHSSCAMSQLPPPVCLFSTFLCFLSSRNLLKRSSAYDFCLSFSCLLQISNYCTVILMGLEVEGK